MGSGITNLAFLVTGKVSGGWYSGNKRVGCSTIAGYIADAGKGNRRKGFRRRNKSPEKSTILSMNERESLGKGYLFIFNRDHIGRFMAV
jgi:hypothetical protein